MAADTLSVDPAQAAQPDDLAQLARRVDELVSAVPHLIGIRHHSPALAAAMPALLEAAAPDAILLELPAEAQPWLQHLSAPDAVAPLALVLSGPGGGEGFYPFADFSPELAALRWAREHQVHVMPIDLPVSLRAQGGDADGGEQGGDVPAQGDGQVAIPQRTARQVDLEELWDVAVEAHSYGSDPQALRRAGLAVGLQQRDAEGAPDRDTVRREAWMRAQLGACQAQRPVVIVGAYHAPAVAGATHPAAGSGGAPLASQPGVRGALGAAPQDDGDGYAVGLGVPEEQAHAVTPGPPGEVGSAARDDGDGYAVGLGVLEEQAHAVTPGPPGEVGSAARDDGDGQAVGLEVPGAATPAAMAGPPDSAAPDSGALDNQAGAAQANGVRAALIGYEFALLDSRSGYPAGIRDPAWQQAVFEAGGDPHQVARAATAMVAQVCAELRADGHTASTADVLAAEQLMRGLAVLRGLPAPGRRELIEALQSVLTQGEPLGRARAVAKAAQRVLVGERHGHPGVGAPRSGLATQVPVILEELGLPHPGEPASQRIRLDPLRSRLDERRELALQRMCVLDPGYATARQVAGTGGAAALSTSWEAAWTPMTAALVERNASYGVGLAEAITGLLSKAWRETQDGPLPGRTELLERAARCGLAPLVSAWTAALVPDAAARGSLGDLLALYHLLTRIDAGQVPGLGGIHVRGYLPDVLSAALSALRGLAGAASPDDARALVELVHLVAGDPAGEELGRGQLVWHLRHLAGDEAPGTVTGGVGRPGAPLAQGAACAALVTLDERPVHWLAVRLSGWLDDCVGAPPGPDNALRLTGALIAGETLLEGCGELLAALRETVMSWSDGGFLRRLPTARAAFAWLTPAARGRLLDALGVARAPQRPGAHDDPELLARWAAADLAGRQAVAELLGDAWPPGTALQREPRAGRAAVPGAAPTVPAPTVPAPTVPVTAGTATAGAAPATLGIAGTASVDAETGCDDAAKGAQGATPVPGQGPPVQAGRWDIGGSDPGPAGEAGGLSTRARQVPQVDDRGCAHSSGATASPVTTDAPGAVSPAPPAATAQCAGASNPQPGRDAGESAGDAGPSDHAAARASTVSPATTGGSSGAVATASGTGGGLTAPDGLGEADRWRLILAQQQAELPAHARRMATALDELYGAARGEGSLWPDGDGAGTGPGYASVREWEAELDALFGATVREEVLATAAAAGRVDALVHLGEQGRVTASVDLLEQVLSLAGALPEERLGPLRALAKRMVDQLVRQLAQQLSPALAGLATPRPTAHPGGPLDLGRTVRRNLPHAQLIDGRPAVIPRYPVFSTRARRTAAWDIYIVVDVSGSMERSVIYAALIAAVLHAVPALSVHLMTFSDQVVDMTGRVDDPLALLLEIHVGGGTLIGQALGYVRQVIQVPARSIVALISDFEDGGPLDVLLGHTRALAESGAHVLGLAAVDGGQGVYNAALAGQLVAAGMPVAALSPLEVAEWVGRQVRGGAQ